MTRRQLPATGVPAPCRILTGRTTLGLTAAMMLLAALGAGGCATADSGSAMAPSQPPAPDVLRVGVTANMPPMIFKEGGAYRGIEADLAQRLGTRLGRRVVFVDVPWEQQIDALIEGRTDIIMSSMTITAPRQFRIHFSKPYMNSGQAALVRRDEVGKIGLFLFNERLDTGVQKGTTGDYFVQQYMHNANRVPLTDAGAGAEKVADKKLDLLIHDAPVIWWWASKHESHGLTVLPTMLTQELLGWGLRKGDAPLQEQVNAFIDDSARDGSLQAVIAQWLPGFPGR